MDPSIIPFVSMSLSMYKTQQTIDTSLLKNAMDLSEQGSDFLIQSMSSLSPYLGQQLDVCA
jgi:hypothetical protein